MLEKKNDLSTWLSRYYSKDMERHADIFTTYNGYHVDFYENESFVTRYNCWEHTRQYAEDCAENWVERIIK